MGVELNKRTELPGRFELGTEAWREEAVAFLNKEISKVRKARFRDDLPGVTRGVGDTPFSICETLTNAPPHLGFKDDTSVFSLSYDGNTFTATDQANPDADMKVSGDYQAALFMAQVVGFAEPGRLEASGRSLAHTFGDVLRQGGEIESPAARELMVKLHDHLARKTVENPDLAHRARRLGIVDHIVELEEKGYTVVPRMLSEDFTDALREQVLKHSALIPGKNVPGLLHHGRLFEDLVQHPVMMSLVDATLGRGAILGYSIGNQRFPGKGFISLHSDDNLPHPFPEWPMTTNCLIALDDWNSEAAGPTWVIPGSHKMRRAPDERDEETGGVPILMPKGSLLALTSNVWHWQGDRSDPRTRVTINAHYFRRFLRPHESLVRDEKVLYRNPPRLHELLGLDDGCETGPFEGRDYKRFAYMAELNAFNDARRSELLSNAG